MILPPPPSSGIDKRLNESGGDVPLKFRAMEALYWLGASCFAAGIALLDGKPYEFLVCVGLFMIIRAGLGAAYYLGSQN